MPRCCLILALGLALPAACNCTERNVGDDPPRPDVEGICQTYCGRVHECGFANDDTVEECIEECIGLQEWDDPDCVGAREAIHVCLNEYDCPEFTNHITCNLDDQPDHECCPEMNALVSCRSG